MALNPQDDDNYPYTSVDSSKLGPDEFQTLLATNQIVDNLASISVEVKRLAAEDGGKVVGTLELQTRMDELKLMLDEHKQMIQEQRDNPMVQTSLSALRRTLISSKLILRKALDCSFRRSHKFKNPIRISINDLVICSAKLGHAISLAYAKPGAAQKLLGIKPGQEECLLGDKYYFGHGVPQDFAKAMDAYKV